MKALWFDGKLAVRDVESPKPGLGEARIQVLMAGICGTDREILKGYSGFRGILGHEFVGRVTECAEEKWVGKRVVGEINISCGECNLCLWGLGRHCPHRTVMGILNRNGVFAEEVVVPTVNLHAVPDEIPDEAAVFVEPLAAAAEILEQIRIPPGSSVGVLGDGRLGLLVAQVLHHAKTNVTLIGKHASKLDLARSWKVQAIEAGQVKPRAPIFSVVVEATGSPTALETALQLVESRGTVVMKSTFRERAGFDTAKLVVDEITLLGSRCGNFETAIDLLRNGHVHVKPMISKILPLESAREAFASLNDPTCIKVLLAPNPRRT